MNISILPRAFQDIENAREFYEKQGDGLGEYFLNSIFADIDSLRLFAGIHPIREGFHRMLSENFPYSIYYDIEGDSDALVRAVVDARSRPAKIVRRLRGERRKR